MMEPSKNRSRLILLIVLVGLLVIAGFVFGQRSRTTPYAESPTTTEQTMPPLSEGSDTASLDADLQNTDFSELDAELK